MRTRHSFILTPAWIAATLLLALGCEPEASDPQDDLALRDLDFDAGCAPYAATVNSLDFFKVGLIRDTSVVDDPCRTNYNPTIWANNKCAPTTQGRWSFWYLMSQAAGTGNTSEFVLKTLESLENEPVVNGFKLQKRGGIRTAIINPWREKSGCAKDKKYDDDKCPLKPEFAPFRLLAIVNRTDLRPGSDKQIGYGQADDKDFAGEGRFVFGFLDNTKPDPNTADIMATIILEYQLQTKTKTRVDWANQWISLNSKTFGNAVGGFNQTLQVITDGFATKGVFAGKPNLGSALNTVRTNERAFGLKWSLREFRLTCVGNCDNNNARLLAPSTVAMTPHHTFENHPTLYKFFNENAPAIRAAAFDVPLLFDGMPFKTGEAISDPFGQSIQWGKNFLENTNEVDPNLNFDTRRLFGIATCNGCHYFETANGLNQHIRNRDVGAVSQVSDFLNPAMQPLEVPGLFELNVPPEPSHFFNEPRRRLCELAHTSTGKGNLLSNFFGG